MEHSCFVPDCNNSSDKLVHYGDSKWAVCQIHLNQRERVSQAVKNTLTFINTFSEIFTNQAKNLIEQVLTSVKNTTCEFDSLKKRLNLILKKLYIPQRETSTQDLFFDRILNVSSEIFEKEIKKLENFRKDEFFDVLDKDLKFSQVDEISNVYKKELEKVGNFLDSLKIDPDSGSEFLSLVTEKSRKNTLHQYCKNNGKIYSSQIFLYPSVYYPATCDLPNSTIFIGGGIMSDEFVSKKCYLYDPGTSKLEEKPETSNLTILTGIIYFRGFCYCFGGRISGISYNKAKRFNFAMNSWEDLSDVPCESSIHNPTLHNECIWMCGYLYDFIFYYNIDRNCYFRLSIQLQHQRKSLLKLRDRLYILINNRIYLIQGATLEEICQTKSISIIRSIETEDSIVFHDGSWVYKFTPSIKFVAVLERLAYNPVKPHW